MPSIGKMAAQMTLDSGQFTQGLRGVQAELTKFGKENQAGAAPIWLRDQDVLSKAEKGFSLGAKSIKQLGKAAGSANVLIADFTDSSTKGGQALVGLAQAAALAASGNYILGAVFALKALVTVFHSLTDLTDDVSKAFDAIVDGSKSAEKAVADLRLENITSGIKDLFKDLRSLESLYESFIGKFVAESLGALSPGLAGHAEEGLAEIARRAESRVAILQHLMGLPAMQALLAEARSARAQAQLSELREELALRGRLAGLTEDQARLERLRRALPSGIAAEAGGYVSSILAQLVGGGNIDLSRIGGPQAFADSIGAIIKWQEWIKKANESFQEFAKEMRAQADALGTPFENAAEQIERLNMAFELGIVDLDEYDQLIEGVLDKLDQATRIQQANAPGALAAGSQAAYSAFNTAQRQEMGGSQADRLLRAAEREAESQERTLNESRRTRQILEDRLPSLGLAR